VDHKRVLLSAVFASGISQFRISSADQDPTGLSRFALTFSKEIFNINSEVSDLLCLIKPGLSDKQQKGLPKSGSFYTVPTFVGGRDESSVNQIDRLFTSVNRLHLSRMQELFDGPTIIGGIVMYALKTYLELIRLECFGNQIFNQVQVDGFVMYRILNDKMKEQELFAALIEEIISSAADRTVDPVPLDVSVLERICSEVVVNEFAG
jgi:hypothetical protein